MGKNFWDPEKPEDQEYDPYRDPSLWSFSAPTVDRTGSGTASTASPLPPSAPTLSAQDADVPGQVEAPPPAGGGNTQPPPPVVPGNNAPGSPTATSAYYYPWQQSPSGNPMDIWQFNNLKSTFPDMSDQEVWQHLNYDKAPDSNFMRAIIQNIRNARAAKQQQTQTTNTTNTSTTTVPPKTGPLNPQDFWDAVAGMPVSRGNLQPVVDKLKAVGYADARVTGEDTIFVAGQEWDIVPAGDKAWQLIPDNGGNSGGGPIDFNSLIGQIGSANAAPNPLRDAILASLQEIIKQNSGPLGDVGATPQAQANRNATQRAAEFQRSAMAERLSAEGLGNLEGEAGSGAFDSEVAGINQARGEANAKYEAELADRMLTQRHDRLMSALQLGAGYLTDEQRLQLQQELQQTQAALDVTRMMLQNQQFYDNLYVGG